MTRRPRSDETIREAAARPVPERHTVGVAVFRKRVGEYLQRVAAGDTIVVTDGDRVVAELRPAAEQPAVDHPLMANPHLAELVRRGGPALVDGSRNPTASAETGDAGGRRSDGHSARTTRVIAGGVIARDRAA